jgi:hypothetical protein
MQRCLLQVLPALWTSYTLLAWTSKRPLIVWSVYHTEDLVNRRTNRTAIVIHAVQETAVLSPCVVNVYLCSQPYLLMLDMCRPSSGHFVRSYALVHFSARGTFVRALLWLGSRDSSVGIATGLQARRLRNRSSIPGRGKRFVSFS